MQHFEPNKVGRDFVVGDIHGCFGKLTDNLKQLNFNFDIDRLFCTGDLVDRGPESHLALDWLAYPNRHVFVGTTRIWRLGMLLMIHALQVPVPRAYTFRMADSGSLIWTSRSANCLPILLNNTISYPSWTIWYCSCRSTTRLATPRCRAYYALEP